jgi:hypothetical protein
MRAATFSFIAVLVAGCGGDDERPSQPPGQVTGAECSGVVAEHVTSGGHVPDCSPVSYSSSPPNAGEHYGSWAAFGVYDVPLPHGFLVHNLEHGAVAFSYRCEEDCADEIASARAVMDGLDDPNCERARVILTPDPTLASRWAASAWGFTLQADCFDEQLFTTFYRAHVGQGPEQVCAPGIELRNADGTLDLPPECG